MGDYDDYMADYNGNNNNNDEAVCMIYDKEDAFTVFVQLLLAFLALLSLWFKRNSEKPKRTFRTWFLDISKQAFGACYAHVLNMVIAALLAKNVAESESKNALDDQCAWYGLSYLIDTTLGLLLSIIFLDLLDRVANEQDWVSLKHSGVYVGTDGIMHWIHQVVAWMLILTIVKLIVYGFMAALADQLAWFGGLLFEPFQFNIRFELLFVMIFFPGFLNVIYFWIADGYLKAKSDHAGAHEDQDEIEAVGAEAGRAHAETEQTKESETPYKAMPEIS